jgi:hypothetical protein
MKIPLIQIVVERSDGRRSEAKIEGDAVTSAMLDSAEDLLHTLTTGERPIIKNLYDLAARAFGTTREDAKERITAATYGMSSLEIARRSRVTDRDRRRIADGDRALALPDPQSDDEIRAQLEILHDGICALQSLDDLGEEGNRRAHENLCELEKRYWERRARLGHTARTAMPKDADK